MAAEMWWEQEKWAVDVVPYAIMIRAFLEGRLTGQELQILYCFLLEFDTDYRPPEIRDLLNEIGTNLDSFCADNQVSGRTAGLNEKQLKARVRDASKQLSEVATERPSYG